MTYLYISLLFLFVSCDFSKTDVSSGASATTINLPTRVLHETVFTDATSLIGWQDNASGFSFVGSDLVASGGAHDVNKYLEYQPYITNMDRIKFSVRIKALEANSITSFGFGFGLAGIVPDREWISQISFIDSVPTYYAGQPYLYYQGTTLAQLGSGTGVNGGVSIGDIVRMETTLDRDTWKVQIFNETKHTRGAPLSYTAPLSAPAAQYLPFASRFRIYNFGGANALVSFKAETVVSAAVDVAVIGDSIFGGYYSGALANTIQAKIEAANPSLKVQMFGGGGSTIPSLLLGVDQMKSSLSSNSKVFIHCGGNDIFGMIYSLTDIVNNMVALKTELESTGADVYVLGPVPILLTLTPDVPTLHSMYAAQFGSKYIDVFTPLSNGSGDINPVYFTKPGESSPIDGVHPIATGHALIANIINAKLAE